MWRKGHLARECPHRGNSVTIQNQPPQTTNNIHTNAIEPTLFPATNPTILQTITAENPISAEIWQSLMEQLQKLTKITTKATVQC